MKITKILGEIIAILLTGFIVFKLVIPNVNFSLWTITAEEIKVMIAIGYLGGVLLHLYKLPKKIKEVRKNVQKQMKENKSMKSI